MSVPTLILNIILTIYSKIICLVNHFTLNHHLINSFVLLSCSHYSFLLIAAWWKFGAVATFKWTCAMLQNWLGKRWEQVWSLWKRQPDFISESNIWGSWYWYWNRWDTLLGHLFSVYVKIMG